MREKGDRAKVVSEKRERKGKKYSDGLAEKISGELIVSRKR